MGDGYLICEGSYHLGNWVSNCEAKYRKGKLSLKHIQHFETLGVPLEKTIPWEARFQETKAYLEASDTTYIPKIFPIRLLFHQNCAILKVQGNEVQRVLKGSGRVVDNGVHELYFRTCTHRDSCTSFRQILPVTASKILEGRQPVGGFLPCH